MAVTGRACITDIWKIKGIQMGTLPIDETHIFISWKKIIRKNFHSLFIGEK